MSTSPQVTPTDNPNPVTAPELSTGVDTTQVQPAPQDWRMPEGSTLQKQEDGKWLVGAPSGEQWKGTPEEVMGEVIKAFNATKQWGRDAHIKLDEFQQRYAPLPPPLTPEQQEEQRIDEAFVQILARIFKKKDGNELISSFQRMEDRGEQWDSREKVQAFYADKEKRPFVETPQNADALMRAVKTMVPGITDNDITPALLKGAYDFAVTEGWIVKQNPGIPFTPTTPAPMMPGTQPEISGQVQNSNYDPWGVPLKDLQTVLRNAGQKVR